MVGFEVEMVDWIWCPWSVSHSLTVTAVYVLKLRETQMFQILKSCCEVHFWSVTKNGLVEFFKLLLSD